MLSNRPFGKSGKIVHTKLAVTAGINGAQFIREFILCGQRAENENIRRRNAVFEQSAEFLREKLRFPAGGFPENSQNFRIQKTILLFLMTLFFAPFFEFVSFDFFKFPATTLHKALLFR